MANTTHLKAGLNINKGGVRNNAAKKLRALHVCIGPIEWTDPLRSEPMVRNRPAKRPSKAPRLLRSHAGPVDIESSSSKSFVEIKPSSTLTEHFNGDSRGNEGVIREHLSQSVLSD